MKRSRFALIGLSDVQATALISTKKEDTKVEEPKKDSPPVLQTVGDNSAGMASNCIVPCYFVDVRFFEFI